MRPADTEPSRPGRILRPVRPGVHDSRGSAAFPSLHCPDLHAGPHWIARCTAALEASGLVNGLDAATVDQIAQVSEEVHVEAHSEVFEEGQTCNGLWILAEGRVRLHHADRDGRHLAVAFLEAGSSMQLGDALEGRPYSASATALDDSTLVCLSRPALLAILGARPVFARNALHQLCLELGRRDIAASIAALLDASGRIRCSLVQLLHQFGEPIAGTNGSRIAYRLTRQDIADRSGVTLETAIRVLSQLQHQGMVTTRSQILEIADIPAFKAATGCSECQFDCSVFRSERGARLLPQHSDAGSSN